MPGVVCPGLVQQQPGGGRGAGHPGQDARAARAECEEQPDNKRDPRVQVGGWYSLLAM